jgi:hypothetical protein
MYRAVVEVKNTEKKKQLIGQFMLSKAAREADSKFS